MRLVHLPGIDGSPLTVRLRPLIGEDELALAPEDPAAATTLLARLASDAAGVPLDMATLSVSRCDRLLGALYGMLYGPRAECRCRCTACAEAYEFTLALPEMIAAQDAERPAPSAVDGAWPLPDGRRVRAPTLGDLAAAATSDALLARLVLAGDAAAAPEAVTAFLERAAPVLSLDLDAACPHCGAAQAVRFDLGRYLAQRIAAERPFLLRETHLIASRYTWSQDEIMRLAREDRRAFAALIEAERGGLQWRRVA